MASKTSKISLMDAMARRKSASMTVGDIRLLKQFGLIDEDEGLLVENYHKLQEMKDDSVVSLIDGVITEWSKDGHRSESVRKAVESSSGNQNKNKEKMEEEMYVGSKVISTGEEAKKESVNDSFNIDLIRLKAQLEAYLSLLPKEEEGYTKGEIVIWHFDKEPSNELVPLISAGTRILDAMLYATCRENEGEMKMFSLKQVTSLTAKVVATNVDNAKKAIKAGVVLFWTQGSLPTVGQDEKKQVPRLVKEGIYKNLAITGNEIAAQLSSTSTLKFPASIFLELNLDLLPHAVASRCKLSIAGNRAIRYAAYACNMEKRSKISLQGVEDIDAAVARNQRIDKCHAICNFLVSLNGNHVAQAKMHPMAPKRPVVKNLTLKLTRAVIESLTSNGRMAMRRRVIDAKNNAFQIDKNFFGEEVGDEVVWSILENTEADFNDVSVEALRSYYGVAAVAQGSV
nr:TPA_asm: coat protein [Primula ophiovirus]